MLMKQRYFCVFVVLFIAVLCQAAASERTYNVLFIQSYTSQTPWHRDLNQGLVKGFKDNGLKVNITTEYLDADFGHSDLRKSLCVVSVSVPVTGKPI